MAYVTDIRRANLGLSERISGLYKAFQTAREQRRAYINTLTELRSMSARDLADIGISRSEIPFLAREAAEQVK